MLCQTLFILKEETKEETRKEREKNIHTKKAESIGRRKLDNPDDN